MIEKMMWMKSAKKKADNKERGVEQLWKYREDPSTLAEERNSEDAATKREPVRNERQHEGRWKIWGGKWSDEWKEGEGERVGGMGNPRAGDRWAWVRWSGGGRRTDREMTEWNGWRGSGKEMGVDRQREVKMWGKREDVRHWRINQFILRARGNFFSGRKDGRKRKLHTQKRKSS